MPDTLTDRLRRRLPDEVPPRLAGALLTAVIQLLLLWMLISLAPATFKKKVADMVMFSVNIAPDSKDEAASEPEAAPDAPLATSPEPQEAPPPPTPPVPQPAPPVETPPLSAEQPVFDLAKAPTVAPRPAPSAPMMGPPDLRRPEERGGDSPRVGTTPSGEPLYAAQWVREPYPDELRGYLQSARGPGWGLIICRTVPGNRVDDCEILDEFPSGSGLGRAVQAAAWQFQVRPPRVGGRLQVGEWVQIRICDRVSCKGG